MYSTTTTTTYDNNNQTNDNPVKLLKKLWNMKVIMISIVVGLFGTVPDG